MPDIIAELKTNIDECRICRDQPMFPPPLAHEPRPIITISSRAKIAIAGQAPGNLVNQTGIPFNDPSGQRLRQWMGVSREQFYDSENFAIIPMGFCFPGYNPKGGDLPPRKECALSWHNQVFETIKQVEIVLAIGLYAQNFHIQSGRHKTLTQNVAHWREILSKPQPRGYVVLPLPHPSWHNNRWIKNNPWFSQELLPCLKEIIQDKIHKNN